MFENAVELVERSLTNETLLQNLQVESPAHVYILVPNISLAAEPTLSRGTMCHPCNDHCNKCFGPTGDDCIDCASPFVELVTSCIPQCPLNMFLDTSDNFCKPRVCPKGDLLLVAETGQNEGANTDFWSVLGAKRQRPQQAHLQRCCRLGRRGRVLQEVGLLYNQETNNGHRPPDLELQAIGQCTRAHLPGIKGVGLRFVRNLKFKWETEVRFRLSHEANQCLVLYKEGQAPSVTELRRSLRSQPGQ